MEKLDYGKSLNFFNKWFYSCYFPAILVFAFYFINKYIINNLSISIILYVILIIIWIIRLVYVPKNKSLKYGIIFLVDNSTYYNDNRNLFFKKLSFSLENYFKILIINKNCFKKYDTEDSKKKIMNKKNYQMIINTFAMDAEDNDDYVCSLDNKSIIFAAPQSCIDEDTIKKLQTDFNNGFHKIIKLRKKEAFSDINNNTNLMANSIRYFVSIIFTIFGELEQATKLLNEIDLSTLPPSNKLVHYLNKNIICRYINIEFIYSLRIINKQEYLYNKQELMELEEHLSKLEVLIKSNSIYQNFLLDFYDMKAKVLFAKQDYYNALGLLNIINRKSPGNYITLLSIAFMHINMNNYIDGIKYYKRVSNRKDIDIHKINECISFIKNSLKSEDSNKILLNICLGIITFYWKNRYEGKVILQKTLKTVENEEMKKYIETRYIR